MVFLRLQQKRSRVQTGWPCRAVFPGAGSRTSPGQSFLCVSAAEAADLTSQRGRGGEDDWQREQADNRPHNVAGLRIMLGGHAKDPAVERMLERLRESTEVMNNPTICKRQHAHKNFYYLNTKIFKISICVLCSGR